MDKVRTVALAGASVALIALVGCGAYEPTAEESAAAAEHARLEGQQELAAEIAGFEARASQTLIPQLDALTIHTVADVEAAAETALLFEQTAREIRRIENAASWGGVEVSPQTLTAKDRLKTVLIRTQRRLYPAMRRAYADHLSRAVAEAQANYRAVGKGNRTLRAASPALVSEATAMEAHYSVLGHARRFRFSRAEYVYASDGRYRFFDISSPADGDLSS